MNFTEFKITKHILDYSNEPENSYSAILHWRWSQFERIRRSLVRLELKDLPFSNTEEYSVLVFISFNDSPTSTDITSYLKMEKSTVSEFIKRCISKQLILEIKDEKDKRKIHYVLTTFGKQTLDSAHQKMANVNRRIFGLLDDNQKQNLLELLVFLNENYFDQFYDSAKKNEL
jgi:DNA-binding MarR family transcriptional regulator